MREEWAEIPGTLGFYEASNMGAVRSWRGTGQSPKRRSAPFMLKATTGTTGYPYVYICYPPEPGGKVCRRNRTVHSLVLESFIGPRPSGMVARHKDGVRTNCRLDNLEYGTQQENMADKTAHGTLLFGSAIASCKLIDEQVLEIINTLGPHSAIASRYGVSRATVSRYKRLEGRGGRVFAAAQKKGG